MLNVGFVVEEKYTHRFHYLFQIQDELRHLGINIRWVQDLTDPHADVFVVQQTFIRKAQLQDQRPLMVYERIGGAPASVVSAERKLLQHPNVCAWLKETSFRDLRLNNAPMIAGRYHLTLINDLQEKYQAHSPDLVLGTNEFRKFHCCFPIHLQDRYDYLRASTPPPLSARRIGVCYAGTMNYDHELVGRHRRKLAHSLVKESERYYVFVGLGQVLSRKLFEDTLMDTKVFVSPYGSGEYSWKDFEAIYAGCILVKVRSDFVEHYGFDIYYRDRYSIQCAPDFSDLSEILERIFSEFDRWSHFADDARRTLLSARDDAAYARYWADMIQKSVGGVGSAIDGSVLQVPTAGNAAAACA